MNDMSRPNSAARLSEDIGDVLSSIRRLIAEDEALTAAHERLQKQSCDTHIGHDTARDDEKIAVGAEMLAGRHGGNAALARQLAGRPMLAAQAAPQPVESAQITAAPSIRPHVEPGDDMPRRSAAPALPPSHGARMGPAIQPDPPAQETRSNRLRLGAAQRVVPPVDPEAAPRPGARLHVPWRPFAPANADTSKPDLRDDMPANRDFDGSHLSPHALAESLSASQPDTGLSHPRKATRDHAAPAIPMAEDDHTDFADEAIGAGPITPLSFESFLEDSPPTLTTDTLEECDIDPADDGIPSPAAFAGRDSDAIPAPIMPSSAAATDSRPDWQANQAETAADLADMAETAPENPGQITAHTTAGTDQAAQITAQDHHCDSAIAADPAQEDDAAEMLIRDTIRDMIQEELHGELGQRFSRNLRAVIRREIAAAIDEQMDRF